MTGSSSKPRASSIDSNSSEVSFHRLQRILEDGMTALGLSSIPKLSSKFGHKSGKRSLRHSNNVFSRAFSSDTEYIDGDVVVPSCDAFLDNSKTLGQGLKAPGLHPVTSRREEKERQAWISFKNEVVRLAHTLRLKGWRHVPLDSGESISVERLSGALTNAVYVVSPPANLVTDSGLRRKGPGKVLLRVYGPQVEHLIDRENELGVMRRLARKKIGPRLLGTFLNGRFEEYFDAIALTPALLREPETSKQIAKRMRELHDGVELLEEEKDAGPNVWSNWDRWLDQVEKTMLFLDQRVLSGTVGPSRGPGDSWKSCGLICGVQWAEFKAMVEKYRNFLGQHYGESRALREQLVFAHNDVSGSWTSDLRDGETC